MVFECFKKNKAKNIDMQLTDLVTKGGFGKIYKGNYTYKSISKKNIAIKEVLKKNYHEIEYLISKKTKKYQNLIYCFDKLFLDNTYYLFFEFYENGDLFDYIIQNNLPSLSRCKIFLYQMLNSLATLNKIGFIHMDIN